MFFAVWQSALLIKAPSQIIPLACALKLVLPHRLSTQITSLADAYLHALITVTQTTTVDFV